MKIHDFINQVLMIAWMQIHDFNNHVQDPKSWGAIADTEVPGTQ